MRKLYCYVDESGQDTTAQSGRERIFIVAVAVFEDDLEALEQACKKYEIQSGKRQSKWRKTNPESRAAYWQMIISDEQFKRTLCYSRTIPPLNAEFDARTILSIAKAILWHRPGTDYTSDIYVDGISVSKQVDYANELRKIGIHVHRVRRAVDEKSALIRLADALAGLAREAAGGNQVAEAILRQAMKRGIVAMI